ncbi:MAG: FmdB family zinc ribbon protein [Candidatus Methylomirabilia bacterium]
MPTYEYECKGCQRTFEIRQRISEPPLERCPDCGSPIRRVLAPTTFILKGAGFYTNDYPSESRKKAMEAEKKPATDSSGSSASTPTSSESSTS